MRSYVLSSRAVDLASTQRATNEILPAWGVAMKIKVPIPLLFTFDIGIFLLDFSLRAGIGSGRFCFPDKKEDLPHTT